MKQKVIVVRMNEELWKKFKVFCVENEMSMTAMIRTFIKQCLAQKEREKNGL